MEFQNHFVTEGPEIVNRMRDAFPLVPFQAERDFEKRSHGYIFASSFLDHFEGHLWINVECRWSTSIDFLHCLSDAGWLEFMPLLILMLMSDESDTLPPLALKYMGRNSSRLQSILDNSQLDCLEMFFNVAKVADVRDGEICDITILFERFWQEFFSKRLEAN